MLSKVNISFCSTGTENYHKYPKLFGDLDEKYDELCGRVQNLRNEERKDTNEYRTLKKKIKALEKVRI
jgi:chaperonin cofactor prefoldin